VLKAAYHRLALMLVPHQTFFRQRRYGPFAIRAAKPHNQDGGAGTIGKHHVPVAVAVNVLWMELSAVAAARRPYPAYHIQWKPRRNNLKKSPI